MEDKIIFAKAETSGSTSADLIALNDLESEINSNKKSLERLVNSGNEMIQDDHYAKTDIQGRIRFYWVSVCLEKQAKNWDQSYQSTTVVANH